MILVTLFDNKNAYALDRLTGVVNSVQRFPVTASNAGLRILERESYNISWEEVRTLTSTSTQQRGRSRIVSLLAVLLMSLAGVIGVASPASADTKVLCSGNSYSTCINKGYTAHGYENHQSTMYWTMYAGHNCTNYAAYMAIGNGASTPPVNLGLAKDWDDNAQVPVNNTPAKGAIAQWNANAGPATWAGHVAYVEKVTTASNGVKTITISEDNYDVGPFTWKRITSDSSDWPSNFIHFADVVTPPPPPVPVPVVDNVFWVNTGWDINWEYTAQFGQDGDKAVVGDFDGNGTDTPAVYRGNTFYVNTGWDGNYEFSTQFGQAGDQPLVGDWDGDGIDTPAVRRGNVFYVNTGWDSSWEYSVTFGQSGDQAMVGDWDGNGTDTPAVYRGNTFYVNTGWDANWEFSTVFGQSGDKALVGDWTGGGIDTPAVHRGNTFYVNTGWDGNYEFSTQFGETADHSLVGDWDGEGLDTPAVRREILT